MIDTLLGVYFGTLLECVFWIISIVIDKLWLLTNIVVIIMFVLNYVCFPIF